jgi:hypothetical protein
MKSFLLNAKIWEEEEEEKKRRRRNIRRRRRGKPSTGPKGTVGTCPRTDSGHRDIPNSALPVEDRPFTTTFEPRSHILGSKRSIVRQK